MYNTVLVIIRCHTSHQQPHFSFTAQKWCIVRARLMVCITDSTNCLKDRMNFITWQQGWGFAEKLWGCGMKKTQKHAIHGTNGIFTYIIWLILMVNVGKYNSPMDGMGKKHTHTNWWLKTITTSHVYSIYHHNTIQYPYINLRQRTEKKP